MAKQEFSISVPSKTFTDLDKLIEKFAKVALGIADTGNVQGGEQLAGLLSNLQAVINKAREAATAVAAVSRAPGKDEPRVAQDTYTMASDFGSQSKPSPMVADYAMKNAAGQLKLVADLDQSLRALNLRTGEWTSAIGAADIAQGVQNGELTVLGGKLRVVNAAGAERLGIDYKQIQILDAHIQKTAALNATLGKQDAAIKMVEKAYIDYDLRVQKLIVKYPQLAGAISAAAAAHRGEINAQEGATMALARFDAATKQHIATMRQQTAEGASQITFLDTLAKRFKVLGTYFVAAGGIFALMNAFKLTKDAIIEYDQALHNLQAITGATDEQTTQMSVAIISLASKSKFSLKELTDGLETLAQAGLNANEIIAVMPSVVGLATGTMSSLSTAIDLVTTTMRVWQMEGDQAGHVADVMAVAVNRSKLTIDMLKTAFNYIGPVAEIAGVSMEDVTAIMMEMGNSGMRASTIGTGLRQVLQKILEPTDAFRAGIHKVGLSMSDLDPKTNSMRTIIQRLGLAVTSADDAMQMFGVRGAAAISAIVTHGTSGFDDMRGSLDATGEAARMAGKQAEGLEFIYKNLIAKTQLLAISLGEAGLGAALWLVGKALVGLIDGLTFLSNSTLGKTTIQVALLSGAILLLVTAVSQLWKLFLATSAVQGLVAAFNGLTPAIVLSSTAMAGCRANAIALGIAETELAVAMSGATAATVGFSGALAGVGRVIQGIWLFIEANPFVLLATAVAGATLWAYNHTAALEAESKAALKTAQDHQSKIEVLGDLQKRLKETVGDEKAHGQVIKELIEAYPDLRAAIRDAAGEYDKEAAAIDRATEALKKKSSTQLMVAAEGAANEYRSAQKELAMLKENAGGGFMAGVQGMLGVTHGSSDANKQAAAIEDAESRVKTAFENLVAIKGQIDKAGTGVDIDGVLKKNQLAPETLERINTALVKVKDTASKKELIGVLPGLSDILANTGAMMENKKTISSMFEEWSKAGGAHSAIFAKMTEDDRKYYATYDAQARAITDHAVAIMNMDSSTEDGVKKQSAAMVSLRKEVEALRNGGLATDGLKAATKDFTSYNEAVGKAADILAKSKGEMTSVSKAAAAMAANDFKANQEFMAQMLNKGAPERSEMAKALEEDIKRSDERFAALKAKNEAFGAANPGSEIDVRRQENSLALQNAKANYDIVKKYAEWGIEYKIQGEEDLGKKIKPLQDKAEKDYLQVQIKYSKEAAAIRSAEFEKSFKSLADHLKMIEKQTAAQAADVQSQVDARTMSEEEGARKIFAIRLAGILKEKETLDAIPGSVLKAETPDEQDKIKARREANNKALSDIQGQQIKWELAQGDAKNANIRSEIELKNARNLLDASMGALNSQDLKTEEASLAIEKAKLLLAQQEEELKTGPKHEEGSPARIAQEQAIAKLRLDIEKMTYAEKMRLLQEYISGSDDLLERQYRTGEISAEQYVAQLTSMRSLMSARDLADKTALATGSFTEAWQVGVDKTYKNIRSFGEIVASISEGLAVEMTSNFMSAFDGFTNGTLSATQAMAQFASKSLQWMSELIMKQLMLNALTKATGGFFGLFSSGAVSSATSNGAEAAAGAAADLSYGLAEGGEVPGSSPTPTADNIPIMATAEEWMMPVNAVRHYGKSFMEAIRTMSLPKGAFDLSSMRVPTTPTPRTHYASGGEITGGAGGGVNITTNITVPVDHPKDQDSAQAFGKTVSRMVDERISSMLVQNRRPGGLLYGRG